MPAQALCLRHMIWRMSTCTGSLFVAKHNTASLEIACAHSASAPSWQTLPSKFPSEDSICISVASSLLYTASITADVHGPNHLWRVPGAASTNLDGQLALKQPPKLPGNAISVYQPRRRSTAFAKTRRPCRREAESRDKSRE